MPLLNATGQINDYLHCIICLKPFSERRKPFTLLCSHTCCLSCLETIQYCPYDQTTINRNLPENEAILGLIGSGLSRNYCHSESSKSSYGSLPVEESMGISQYDIVNMPHYLEVVQSIKQITSLLKPSQSPLSRPMQRKLINLLHCQFVEGEGRSRAMRNCRSIGERALSELLIKHQDPHTLSANLWAAVRARGCQFLGPAMQEDVLQLVLLALEDGSALSRKVLVMFVVQRLSPHFPHQASKTAIGHVIQLLYRASCFKLTKRDGDSSLMQLKEEYCSYEALRREHDTQIVSIALEAGLRISPDQWSSLLYGDIEHKSHMQSIIDKLQSPQSFQQSIQELVIALQRTGDPADLGSLKEHFEKLALIDLGLNNESPTHPTLAELASILESTRIVTTKLVQFLRDHANGAYKSSNRIPGANHFYTSLNKTKATRVKPLQSCVDWKPWNTTVLSLVNCAGRSSGRSFNGNGTVYERPDPFSLMEGNFAHLDPLGRTNGDKREGQIMRAKRIATSFYSP